MNSQYFEGILQLRNPPEEAFRVIKNQLKIRENVHIAKEVKQKNLVDRQFLIIDLLQTLTLVAFYQGMI